MKTVAYNFASEYSHEGNALSDFPEQMLLAKIGDDLRDLYADVASAAPPDDLVQLAHLIDQRRGESQGD